MLASEAETKLKVKNQQISRWRKWLGDEKRYRARLAARGFRAGGLDAEANHGALGTGENEWYTPPEFIERAAQAVDGDYAYDGEAGLAPASCRLAAPSSSASWACFL